MSVTHRATGTWAVLTADGPVTIPPTPQSGDRMFLYAEWKDFSVTATVANWTELVEFADGAVSAGNGTGSVKVACWYRDWQPGDTDPTIDFSAAPDNASAVITVMQKGADDVWLTPVAVTAAMTTWTTTSQSVSASATATVPSGGVVMGLIGIRDDTATMTRPTNGIDDSGGQVTWNGNYVESPATHHSTTTGFDGAADLGYRLVSAGATNVTLRMTGTISAAETGAALWVVQGVSTLVTPAAASLITSTFAPLLKLVITPAVAVLTVTSFAPQLKQTITPASAALTTTTFAAQVNQRITAPAATLVVTSFAPQLREVLIPANTTISITGFAPTLTTRLTPAPASLTLSVFAPGILQNVLITVPSASLTITTHAPHVRPFRIIFLDPGGDATHAVGHFNQLIPGFGTDVTYDNTQQVAGAGSYRFDSNTNEAPAVRILNVLSNQRRLSWYWRYDSVPDVSLEAAPFVIEAGIYSGGGFVDGSNLVNDDGSYATATPARNAGQGSVFGPFGFGGPGAFELPFGAIIDSIKIIYEYKVDTADSEAVSRVKWRVDGVEGPNHDHTGEPLTDTVVEVDVTGDRQWERKDLLDGVFEVIAEARRGDIDTAHTQSWDFMKVEVVYHPAVTILAPASNSDAQFLKVAVSPKGEGVGLRLIDVAGTFYNGITELAPDTDYQISLAYSHNAADDLQASLYVNNIPELAAEEMNTGGIGIGAITRLHYGWLVSPGVDHVCRFSHIAIDDGDDLTDIGNVLTTAKLPASVNENGWDTTIGTGAVNERPLNEANRKQHSLTTPARQTYTLQTAATGDVDISGETLIGAMFWAWAKVQFDDFWDLYLVANGVDIDRTNQISPTASLLRHGVASTSYPSNAAGIGMAGSNEAPDTFLYECGAVVAYEGPPNPDILLERQEVANETLDTIIDDLRADPPDSYEVCCSVEEFDGVITIDAYSIDAEGNSPQFQGTMSSSGGTGRMRITPGIEVQIVVTVTGVTMMQIWRRLNVD